MNYITATVLHQHATLAKFFARPSVIGDLSPTHLAYCRRQSDKLCSNGGITATYVSGDHLNIPRNLHFVLDTLLVVVNIRRHYCLIGWAIKWSSKLLFISIPNRPIDNFTDLYFTKQFQYLVKIWKKLQLTFLGHPIELYSCCKYSCFFWIMFLTSFSALLLLLLLFAFILYFISFYFHHIFLCSFVGILILPQVSGLQLTVRKIGSKRSLSASSGCGQCQVVIGLYLYVGLVCRRGTINTRPPPHLSLTPAERRPSTTDE